jgi:hypothetical protein
MRVMFVRTVGARDRVYVERADGSHASWDFPSYGDGLPHDLVHLIVEQRFGVAGGVWGRVAAGADLARINAAANRAGGKDKYRELGDEVVLAEALANAPWTQLELAPDAEALLARMREMAGPRALPASVTLDAIARVRAELCELRERWVALVPKGALDFDYP